MMMTRYEIKKVFSKTSSKIALLVLLVILGITCFFATGVSYVDENGDTQTGPSAVARLRAAQKEWAGWLDEEKISKVIAENRRIQESPEALSNNVREKEIAYSREQGIMGIRDLLNSSYARGFREFDYYRADSLTVEDAPYFYSNRVALLKEWLEADETKYMFNDAEREYLISQYESISTPFYYDYNKGWSQLFEYAATIVMLTMLVLSYLVAGIFSNEFSFKSDAIFFTSFHGRNKAVMAKLKAGFLIVTFIYFAAFFIYTAVTLLYLGADGWNLAIQVTGSWKSFYNITVWQKYLLTVICGYIGCLFTCFLSMMASARTKSSVFAVMIPVILLFLPNFIWNIEHPAISKIISLLPDRLLDTHTALGTFYLYPVGGKLIGSVPVTMVLYTVLTAVIVPCIYQEYRHKQIA